MQTDNLLNTLIVSPDSYLKRALAARLQSCVVFTNAPMDWPELETPLDVLILDATQVSVERLQQQRCLRCNAIIIVLGMGLECEQRINYLEAGADEVISLPMNLAVLIARFDAVLRRARLEH